MRLAGHAEEEEEEKEEEDDEEEKEEKIISMHKDEGPDGEDYAYNIVQRREKGVAVHLAKGCDELRLIVATPFTNRVCRSFSLSLAH